MGGRGSSGAACAVPPSPPIGCERTRALRASVGSTEASDGRLARVGRIDRRIREVTRAPEVPLCACYPRLVNGDVGWSRTVTTLLAPAARSGRPRRSSPWALPGSARRPGRSGGGPDRTCSDRRDVPRRGCPEVSGPHVVPPEEPAPAGVLHATESRPHCDSSAGQAIRRSNRAIRVNGGASSSGCSAPRRGGPCVHRDNRGRGGSPHTPRMVPVHLLPSRYGTIEPPRVGTVGGRITSVGLSGLTRPGPIRPIRTSGWEARPPFRSQAR
jgi:hypothetical protein